MFRKFLYIILLPFSLLFGLVTRIRNFLFDKRVLKSVSFDVPVICVGNLTVGGTGKTPHTEFILSILSGQYKTAMLSRGYKRKTKGFILADKNTSSQIVGDEPYQIYRKYPEVVVAVDEKRVRGIESLLTLFPDLDAIVLDDAYQHRYVTPGFTVLLTDYNNLYTRDFLLPSGRLRESKKGSNRADIIVVTKCPPALTQKKIQNIEAELNLKKEQHIFFSSYKYQELVPVFPENCRQEVTSSFSDLGYSALLMAGIVSPGPIVKQLEQSFTKVETLFFPDHHDFSANDFTVLDKKFHDMNPDTTIVVVTEKDASRLLSSENYPEHLKAHTFALPIQVEILENKKDEFIKKINGYVEKNSRNSKFCSK